MCNSFPDIPSQGTYGGQHMLHRQTNKVGVAFIEDYSQLKLNFNDTGSYGVFYIFELH